MKNRQYHISKMKKTLKGKQEDGVNFVDWSLSKEQLEKVQKWGWSVQPVLYSVKTRKFENIRHLTSHLLKDLHYAQKRGKSTIVRRLNFNDEELLKAMGIGYWPVKYRIHLRGQL